MKPVAVLGAERAIVHEHHSVATTELRFIGRNEPIDTPNNGLKRSQNAQSTAACLPSQMPKTTNPSVEHRALQVLAGHWITQGTIRASGDVAASEMRAIDRYEWLPGGFFMVHKVDALFGGEASQSIEVIGYDAEHGCYISRSYDDRGASDDFTARLENRAWAIDGSKVRFRGAFEAGETILAGTWEQLGDRNQWKPWMDIELRKVT